MQNPGVPAPVPVHEELEKAGWIEWMTIDYYGSVQRWTHPNTPLELTWEQAVAVMLLERAKEAMTPKKALKDFDPYDPSRMKILITGKPRR